jgi:hypothetical protein
MINTLRIVRTWIEIGTAKLNFLLAKLSRKTRQTIARVRIDIVNACTVILTFVVFTIVNIDFTTSAFVARQAFATESSLLQHRTRSIIAARISIASVNHVFTMLSMIARSTTTFVLPFRLNHALGIVFARECETCIAL